MVFKRQLSLVMQESHDDCALACFVMVAKYYGHRCNIMGCRKLNGNINTKNALQFVKLAAYFDIKMRAVRITTQELWHAKRPSILYFGNNHFVVFSRANKNGVIIYDPAEGIRLCSWKNLQMEFSGIIFEFVFYGKKKYKFLENHYVKINDWVKLTNDMKHSRLIPLLCFWALDTTGCLLVPLTQQLINTRVDPELSMLVVYVVILSFIFGVVQTLNEWFKKRFLSVISQSWAIHVKGALLKYIISLPLVTYSQLTRADWYFYLVLIDELKIFIFGKWIPGLWDLLLIIFSMTLFFVFFSSWIWLLLIAMLMQLLITIKYLARKTEHVKVALHRKNLVNLVSWQLLSSVKMIRVNDANKFFVNLWQKNELSSQQFEIQLDHDSTNTEFLRRLVTTVEQVIFMIIALIAVRNGTISMAGMMAIYVAKLQIQQRFTNVITLYESWRTLNVSSYRLASLFSTEPRTRSHNETDPHQISGKLAIDELSAQQFVHISSLFKSVSFSLDKGERLVITGPSGSGKTTLLYLILGLYPVTTGVLKLDNYTFSQWTVADYGNNISCILQDDYLWHGTLLDNILFQEKNIDWDFLNALIDNLHLRQMIEQLNMGLYTPVGEGRCQFSSGQLQRIYLARALYKKPKIIFLDEATSHLDSRTEKDINDYLRKSGISQVIVTHNPALSTDANQVIHLTSK